MPPRERSAAVVTWLLGGTTVDDFVARKQHKPFVVHDLDVSEIWSTGDMLRAVSEKHIQYTKDVNIVKYTGGTRTTLREEGTVTAKDMSEAMRSGWSVRFLAPHEHSEKVSQVIHCMEEVFECHCGANTYYTPAGSQGFAPHFDDVDVFIVQTEGEKEWFVYENEGSYPRYSSEDFSQSELPPPTLHVTLREGDMMYLPRGAIHQARSSGLSHSLHITFSSHQCHTYADYMHALCRVAVERASARTAEMRHTLPHGILHAMGSVARLQEASPSCPSALLAAEFRLKLRSFMKDVVTLCDDTRVLDDSMDAFVKSFHHRRQPPVVLGPEAPPTLTKRSRIRGVSKNAARMCMEAGECRVLTITGNTLRFEECFAPAVATILASYPKYARVRELPMDDDFTEEDASHNRTMLCEALLGTRCFVLAGE